MFEREENTRRFHADPSRPGAVGDATGWLQEYAEDNLLLDAMIWLPTLAQLDNLPAAIGENKTRELRRTRTTRLGIVKVTLVTDRNAPRRYTAGPVLGLWNTGAALDQLDELDAHAICLHAAGPEAEEWRATWNPVDIHTGQPAGAAAPENTAVVTAALRDLTSTVNLTTGISHPSDKQAAVELLKVVRDAGEPLDPTAIKAWTVRAGWHPRHARTLAELAGRVADGRTVHGGRGPAHWRTDILEKWRHDAATDGGED